MAERHVDADVAIPIAVFSVRFETALGRAFSACERTVLRCLEAGLTGYEAIVAEMSMHPRIISESIATLIETGLVDLNSDGTLQITPAGRIAIAEPTYVPEGLRGVPSHRLVVVDRVTGVIEVKPVGLKIHRISELPTGVRCLHPAPIDPTPGRAALRGVLEARSKNKDRTRIRAIAKPRALGGYNQCVMLSAIRSIPWLDELRLTVPGLQRPVSAEPALPIHVGDVATAWNPVSSADIAFLTTPEAHARALTDQIQQAQKYIFVHSAFWRATRLEALSGPIVDAVRRGVDVVLLHGLGNGEEESEAIQVIRKVLADTRGSTGRFYAQESPTWSHAKILIIDGLRACIGSFNWLSADPESARQELSVSLGRCAVMEQITDWSADLFRIGGPAWPAHLLRASTTSEPSVVSGNTVRVRLVPDRQSRQLLFTYLRDARDSLLVGSDHITPLEDPMLASLIAAASERLGPSAVRLRYGRKESEVVPLLGAPGSVDAVQLKGHHAKYAFVDDGRALITSFNLLSFGGASSGRASGFELGVEVVWDKADDRLASLRATLLGSHGASVE